MKKIFNLTMLIILTYGIIGLLLWADSTFGQETRHPSNLCEYQWSYQEDLLPNLKDPKFFKEKLEFGGFTYFFYINKKTKKVKLLVATHINLITGEKTENWTWQDGDIIISTVPKFKWNFCIIIIKTFKDKKLDLTVLRDEMLSELKKEEKNEQSDKK